MNIKTGDKLPNTTFMKMTADGPTAQLTDELFAGKRVALFAVPGAFTPTCSAEHVPNFLERAQDLSAKGIDEIICTSVNDIFVMNSWGKQLNVENSITMIADGNGEFAKAIDLELDGSAYGLGQRSQRYAMIVNDGVVEQIHVEDPGEYKVSSADYMLETMS